LDSEAVVVDEVEEAGVSVFFSVSFPFDEFRLFCPEDERLSVE